ncbi:MAG: 4-hydroxythreonine-4-phosphate dehydrogenase PdxA [Candidatus Omnitrophica bacterium]|nr:4-hydroxythreonine-4-phosphate dehydrogenase PdxA [Candidatus Omnitrophota bacterium]
MLISPTNKPQIFITMGDPSGIGPEVIAKSMASPALKGLAVFIVFGDMDVMARAAETFGRGSFRLRKLENTESQADPDEEAVNIIDPGPPLANSRYGQPTRGGAEKTLSCLDAAVDIMRRSSAETPKALVTAPVNKEKIAEIHPGFVGHTEHLQKAYGSALVTMVLVGETLRVVPVTRHIPLREVASALSVDLIADTLEQVASNRRMITGGEDAKIAVAALNPHCGEGGKIGTEEIDVIAPAVERARKFYENIEGPVSADVVFYKALQKKVDIVVSMYHDQGLSPFKMVDFDNGVNMTLGLGHVRTSPDHGTAFDIAGKDQASSSSMEQAIRLAVRAISTA